MTGDPIILIIFGGIGSLMIIGAFFMWKSTRNLATNGIKTEGKVIDLIMSRSSKGGRTYRPQVGFNAMDGRSMTFISHMGSNPPGYQIGQIVPIIYLPNNPEKAAINTFWQLWGGAVIVGGIGAVFLVISLITYGVI